MIEAKFDRRIGKHSVIDGYTVLCDVRDIVRQEHVGTRHQYPCTDIEATRKRAEHIAEALRHYQASQEGVRVP